VSSVLAPRHAPLRGPWGALWGANAAPAAADGGNASHNASGHRRAPPRNASAHPALSVDWDVDANDDGVVDERDWDLLEAEAERLLAARLDAALGARHWVGPLPLSAADRRLCGAVMGAAQAVLLAVAALVALLAAIACCRSVAR
jgi:hypothetical protein